VSDKGIPAALLMARVMTLAKLLVPTSRDLGLLASVLNTQLEEGNAEMYVHDTVRRESSTRGTAEVRCVSRGHNPPVIVRKSGASLVEVESGRPLGLFEGSRVRRVDRFVSSR
jgi:sigma-B regulation protein RsbU (phosphoserine phosphatase)